MASLQLSDQIVLVTGSSRGLGRAIAEAFFQAGAKGIVINYVNPSHQSQANAVAQELGGKGKCIAIAADVTNPDQVQSLFRAAGDHFSHPITTVVNNALAVFTFNGPARKHLDTISWSDFDAQLQGSLRGALNTTQAAIPRFKKIDFGRIINIGSNLVQNPVVPYHDYTSSKAALLAYTRTVAVELGPEIGDCTSNMVSGGLLQVTDASSGTPEDVFEQIKNVTPLRKVTTPEEVAGAVLFFASPWARGCTGQNINVDGGLVMN